ncbi:MAG: hypothetical protein ABJF10_27205 [Chthoniobacter sp.]|uniref:hypothetical protein n=1 Tax=Chthoniobacter sp. TaxID=2510640 RepID=UPI0032AD1DFA
MKQIYFAAFLLCSALVPVRADILRRPLPDIYRAYPSELIVSNLSAFPKVKFSMGIGDLPREPLEENKTYVFKASTRLFVADADHKAREWATVEYHRSKNELVKILVKKVSYGKGGIKVSYDVDAGPIPPHQPSLPSTAGAWSPFVLSGLGCCGLVLLAPRVRRKAAPDNPSPPPGA